MWKRFKNLFNTPIAVEQYASLTDSMPVITGSPTIQLHCSHWAASYVTDPRTGAAECLPCYNTREGYIRK